MVELEEKLRKMSTSSSAAIKTLLDFFVYSDYAKGAIIGMPEHSFPMIYFLEKGLVRTFINEHGEDHTFWIMENGFILPPKGFFSISPNKKFIQVLEDSKIWSLNLTKAELAAREEPTLYRMLLEIYEEKLNSIHEQLTILNISDALKRFSAFMDKYRNIPSRVDNTQLASLLRINPKHLYRIKNQYYRIH